MSIIARRHLLTELRRIRNERNLTQGQVATEMEWSLSKLIRIEGGTVAISVSDLRSLLAHYGVAGPRGDDLLALARGAKARQPKWWTSYRDRVPAALLTYVGYEAEASSVATFAPIAVPALLQTERYAHAVLGGEQVPVEFRMRRRHELLARNAELVFVLDESVLHRHPAGEATILAEQLESLIEDAQRHNTAVFVLPYTAGAHSGWAGAFTVIDCGGHLLLATESLTLVEDPTVTKEFDVNLLDLVGRSYGLRESIEAIRKAAGELRA